MTNVSMTTSGIDLDAHIKEHIMGTAHFIATVTDTDDVVQNHYRLDPPLDGHTHVVVSASCRNLGENFTVEMYSQMDEDMRALMQINETYIFPANTSGEIVDFGELTGSYRGGTDIVKALRDAGYDTVLDDSIA